MSDRMQHILSALIVNISYFHTLPDTLPLYSRYQPDINPLLTRRYLFPKKSQICPKLR